MNTRVFTLVSSAVALALVAGCTAVYKNAATCEDQMRSAANGEKGASETLTISHTGAGIHGSRVVVEGAFVSTVPASSVAAITAAWARPPASGASATSSVASEESQSSATAAASQTSVAPLPPSATMSVANVQAPVFEPSPAANGASAAKPATQASSKPVKLAIPAAMECRFDGLSLTSFRWLAPGKLITRADSGGGESSE
jgi:hypothetical protein